MRKRLTKSTVDRLQPGPDRYDVIDDQIKGFIIRVSPNGSKTAMLRYRRDNRNRAFKLGVIMGDYTVHQARVDAAKARAIVEAGGDPARERDARRAALTFAEVAERYMTELAGPYMKPSTVVGYRSLLNRHLLPAVGDMKITAIDRQDVIRLHTKIGETPRRAASSKRSKGKAASSKPAKPGGTTKGAANRARSLLSAIMAAAEKWGLRPLGSNPCHGTPKFTEGKIERYLTPEERARFEAVLRAALAARKGQERYVCPGAVDALRLLSFTGARKSEITGLQWSMVDLERACLRLPESKTGAKIVPLHAVAVAFLRQLEARRNPAVPWVCPGEQGRRLHNLGRAWESIRTAAQIPDVRLHDLRHSFASDALNTGVPLAVVGKMLGHKRVETTARYAHLDDKAVRAGVEATGEAIVSSVREGEERLQAQQQAARGGEVIEIDGAQQRAVGTDDGQAQQHAGGSDDGGQGSDVMAIDSGAKVIPLRRRGER